MSFSKGIPLSLVELSDTMMPPITVVSPFFTRTFVVASFLFMLGLPAEVRKLPMEFLLAFMLIRTLPSGVICGVTVRLRFASMKEVAVPEADEVSNGMDSPCSILASLLFIVIILGLDMVFTWPCCSPAEMRKSSIIGLAPVLPSMKPNAPSVPAVPVAGRLTA